MTKEQETEHRRILLIEDDKVTAKLIAIPLTRNGYTVDHEINGQEGQKKALAEDFDAVATDISLPGVNGLDLMREIHEKKPMLPVIVITGDNDTSTAIEATKLGAFDYLVKPVPTEELQSALKKCIQSYRLSTEPIGLGPDSKSEKSIIGQSPVMQNLFKEIGKAAAQEMPVLVEGDTGTGKELVSRAIYSHSARADKPFVALNCAAIPEQLLESELFGHEKGAFTGATSRRIGRFEQANAGTIFLDEIGDMSLSTQAKLLRVLQENGIQRLGGTDAIKVDARLITATHKKLTQAILKNEFREDLYFRLNVMHIRVPSLHERLDDLKELVAYFLKRDGVKMRMPGVTISPSAMDELKKHHWPGNVRELENVIRKCILSAQGYQITLEIVRPIIKHASESIEESLNEPPEVTLERLANRAVDRAIDDNLGAVAEDFMGQCERFIYKRALHRTAGNKSKAAEVLGVSRVTLREKLKRYKLN